MPPIKRVTSDFLGPDLSPKPEKAETKKELHPTVTVKMAKGLVGTVQLILANLPWTKEDVLDDLEQQLLVKDVVAFAKDNAFFARSIVWLFTQMGTAGLVLDSGAIVGKRLARRELVPPAVGMCCDIAVIVSAAAHDIQLDEQQAQIASMFSGLMGGGEDEEDTPPNGHAREFGTPDLVSSNLSE